MLNVEQRGFSLAVAHFSSLNAAYSYQQLLISSLNLSVVHLAFTS